MVNNTTVNSLTFYSLLTTLKTTNYSTPAICMLPILSNPIFSAKVSNFSVNSGSMESSNSSRVRVGKAKVLNFPVKWATIHWKFRNFGRAKLDWERFELFSATRFLFKMQWPICRNSFATCFESLSIGLNTFFSKSDSK